MTNDSQLLISNLPRHTISGICHGTLLDGTTVGQSVCLAAWLLLVDEEAIGAGTVGIFEDAKVGEPVIERVGADVNKLLMVFTGDSAWTDCGCLEGVTLEATVG